MSYFRKTIDIQISWSNKLDKLLPGFFRIDGNQNFIHEFVTPYLTRGALVYDVGGGKQPMITVESKVELGIRTVGLDIDAKELDSAPANAYDATICCDITKYRGNADGDVVICQALLEHVTNVAHALRAIDSILKPGGVALLFVPSSNAVYAKLNLLIPEKLKRAILFRVFPNASKAQGFRAYYDRCTPRDIKNLAGQFGLLTERLRLYYHSNYFAFIAPLYALWRVWTLAFYAIDRQQAAETFSIALRKPALGLLRDQY
jgi:2-polyprenyl-6-hydroxyphenyl methylase/3-demethylubiquinone-9 3-methyltransferase